VSQHLPPQNVSNASGLTPQQQAVVAHVQGHARVVAVAGAGKTTTLAHFIQARVAQGVPLRRILVLMYNKAAQVEFQSKLKHVMPNQPIPDIRTFHSLGLRLYQKLIERGALPAFQGKPLSDGEMEPMVWRLLQQLADDETKQDILSQRKKWVEPALSFIDLVKSGFLPPADVFDSLDLPPQCRIFIELFYQFEDWRKQNRRISFADMIYDPVMCFRAHPEIADIFAGHMQWILVDEYQDINDIQQNLLRVLHGGRGSVMVIGDPDQTIYEFRGSRPEFIVEQFDREMGDVTCYQLPHTFRYGHRLSLMANHLIHHNNEREPVLCLSHVSTPNTRVQLHHARYEPALTLTLIQEEAKQRPLEDIAVINRLWALCAPVELALLAAGIPYQLDNAQSVLERWELRIFWLLLEIASGEFNRRDYAAREEAWLHVLTTPYPKIKRQVLEDLARHLAQVDNNLGEAMFRAIPDSLSQWQKQQLEARAQVLANAEVGKLSAYRLLKDYVDLTEFEQGIEDSAFSAQQIEDRLQTIRAFLRFIRELDKSSEDTLAYLRELRQQRREQRQATGVLLTSIHKSKGREWPVVIIPGLNAHYYPYAPEGEFTTAASEESERRLLYVAMTRAREQLHLLAPAPTEKAARDTTSRDWPSRFDREMAVERCLTLMKTIEQGGGAIELNPQFGALPDWLPQYLEHLSHSGIQTGELKFTMAAPKLSAQRAAVHPPANGGVVDQKFPGKQGVTRVTHDSLGTGVLISQDDQYVKIRFDGEQGVRTLSRDVAADYLKFHF
jgi:DNA helicase-2/ATP-dependent DNA helicase PcrA